MTTSALIGIMFSLSFMGAFMFALAASDLRRIIRREEREVNRLFGHAHRIYPPAPPMQVHPSARTTGVSEPLWRCISK